MTLPEALAIIDRIADTPKVPLGADAETLEALRFIWAYKRDTELREAAQWFKDSLDSENDIGRSQNANAARNRIKWLLGVR